MYLFERGFFFFLVNWKAFFSESLVRLTKDVDLNNLLDTSRYMHILASHGSMLCLMPNDEDDEDEIVFLDLAKL